MSTLTRPSHPPGFMVLHGNRLEDLRDLLVQFLRAQPLAPLAPEVLLVQSAGMKHWLEVSLADDTALGIFAATRMELPSGFLWQVYRQVLGAEQVPTHMPFDKSSLVWRLMRLLPALIEQRPVYQPLQRYLSEAPDGRKLYQLALQLADVLDGYQSYRADWLAAWAQGRDVLSQPQGPDLPLDPAQAWQPALWRDLRADVGEALAEASRAAVHARFMARLQQLASGGERPVGLPERIVVFGISSMSHQAVEALAALGQLSQVLMLVHNPSQYYWGDLVEGHAQLRQVLRRRQRVKPALLEVAQGARPGHPLLASWGKQGRDYLHMLDEFDNVEGYRHRFVRVDAFVDPLAGQAQPSQLAQLQSGMLHLQTPAEPWPLQPDDPSITLVTCHSAQREVEVLHDQLLAWFDADPALRPRDVMVMVPDIAVFAPHIQAVFGRFAPGQPRHIPYSVADRSPRQSPIVQALQALLSLPQSRLTLSDWLGLFEVRALRQRFGLGEVEVDELHGWLQQAGVRWGLDEPHRRRWGLPLGVAGAGHNTWAFGLRRLLLGYALGEGGAQGDGQGGQVWADTLAQPALSGLDATVADALLDWVDAVTETLASLERERPPAEWGQVFRGVVERFFEAADELETRQIDALLVPLEAWLQACEQAGLDSPLPLEVAREHWLSQLQDSGLQQRFLGGGVQFGTLMPMRSIPFKAVCLLGMNDGDYPRQTAPRDFDLMASSWRAGDRSRREDDRYLFLEALLSARDRLYLSWQGHRATDNAERPPSVLVAQLIEHLHSGWSPARPVLQQPLQPFSEAYFRAGSGFRTYDSDWAQAHQPKQPNQGVPVAKAALPPQASPVPVPVPVPDPLSLHALRQLLRQPVEVFFKARLGVVLAELDEAGEDTEPFALDGLDKYLAGQSVLEAADPVQALAELPLSGRLPLAAFGQRDLHELQGRVAVVQERLAPWAERYPQALPAQAIDLQVDGLRLQDALGGLFGSAESPAPAEGDDGLWSGPCLQRVLRPGAVLQGKGKEQGARVEVVAAVWVNHLAGCAQGLALTSTVLGLDGQIVLRPLAPARALEVLSGLVQVYRAAWAQPLPVACLSAWAHGQALRRGKDEAQAHELARAAYEGDYQREGEAARSPYLQRCFQTYAELQAELPRWGEALYGELARQLHLGPIGDAE